MTTNSNDFCFFLVLSLLDSQIQYLPTYTIKIQYMHNFFYLKFIFLVKFIKSLLLVTLASSDAVPSKQGYRHIQCFWKVWTNRDHTLEIIYGGTVYLACHMLVQAHSTHFPAYFWAKWNAWPGHTMILIRNTHIIFRLHGLSLLSIQGPSHLKQTLILLRMGCVECLAWIYWR